MREDIRDIQTGLTDYVKIGTAIFLTLAILLILLVLISVKRRRKMINEKNKIEAEFQQTLLQSQLEIQEQTLKNISQEIHDNIGQALTLAKLNLNTMPAVQEGQQESITTTKEIISKAIGDLRDLSRSLNTDHIAELGLQRALEYELSLIGKSGAIKTAIGKEGVSFRMDAQKELILFRIVQETLNNIIKHADAKTIEAALLYQDDKLELMITDDGKGFAMTDGGAEPYAGLGLRNMHSRAKLIGAAFTIQSHPGTGTTVTIVISKNKSRHDPA